LCPAFVPKLHLSPCTGLYIPRTEFCRAMYKHSSKNLCPAFVPKLHLNPCTGLYIPRTEFCRVIYKHSSNKNRGQLFEYEVYIVQYRGKDEAPKICRKVLLTTLDKQPVSQAQSFISKHKVP